MTRWGRLAIAAMVVGCGGSAEHGSDSNQPAPAPAPPPATNTTASPDTEGADDIPGPPPAPLFDPNVPPAKRLADETARILAAAKTTKYSHVTSIDEATGTFDVDCSGFIDYALSRVVPDAYATLRSTTSAGHARPVAETYVQLVSAPVGRWHRIANASDLVIGDIVAWLTPPDVKNRNTGHVMVVHAPIVVKPPHVIVPVIDSTMSPHGATDSRAATKATGVGTGEIVLYAAKDGTPTGYHWSTDANSPYEKTTVVLGRLE